jgi:hypothetical protein
MGPAEVVPWVILGKSVYEAIQYIVDNVHKRRAARRAKRKCK